MKNERPVYNINMTKQMEFSDTAMNKEAYKDVVFGIYTRDDTYDWKGNVAIKYDTLLATSGIDEEGHLVHTLNFQLVTTTLRNWQQIQRIS